MTLRIQATSRDGGTVIAERRVGAQYLTVTDLQGSLRSVTQKVVKRKLHTPLYAKGESGQDLLLPVSEKITVTIERSVITLFLKGKPFYTDEAIDFKGLDGKGAYYPL